MTPADRGIATTEDGGLLICGTTMAAAEPFAKWPGSNPRLPWFADTSGYRGSFTRAELVDIFRRAWKAWADAIEIDPVAVDSAGQAWITKDFARIDGPSGTLAWSYLADNTNSKKRQRYDSGDGWILDTTTSPSGGIDLLRVAIHEIGHMLGLEHDSGSADAIMRPSYSPRLPTITARDIQRVVGLGYKPRTGPPTSPPTPLPPPVSGIDLALPGGGRLTADYSAKAITYPAGWTARQS